MPKRKNASTGATLRRLIAILDILGKAPRGGGVEFILNHPDIQDFLNTSTTKESQRKMIQRDLKELQNFKFIRQMKKRDSNNANKYKIRNLSGNSISNFLKLSIDDETLKAILLTQDIFKFFDHTFIKESIDDLKDKAVKTYNMSVDSDEPIQSTLKVKHSPSSIFTEPKASILSDLAYAIDTSSLINIKYRTISQKQDFPMDNLESYQLILYDNNIYLLAYNPSADPLKRGFRTLNLMRFKSVDILDKKFVQRDTSNIYDKISHSFGMLTSGNIDDVHITFSKDNEFVTKRLLEKKWHSSADVKAYDDKIELFMHVCINDELARWILQWGNSVVKVEPKNLRDILNNISRNKW